MLYLSDQHRPAILALKSPRAANPHLRYTPDALTGPLRHPYGPVAAGRKSILVADSGNNRIVVLNAKGASSRAIDSGASAIGPLAGPRGVDLAPGGTLVVADTDNHRMVFSGFTLAELVKGVADSTDWTAFGTPGVRGGAGPGEFAAPVSVHIDALGRTLVADPGLDRLIRFETPDGAGWTEIALPPGDRGPRPYGLAAGPDGGVLVTDLLNGRVLLLAADDQVTILIDGAADRSIIAPVAAVLHGGRIVVADAAAAQLTEWGLHARSGRWKRRGHLLGTPGPTDGPSFPRLCGLASTGGTR